MIIHLNGTLVPAAEATISVLDRGFIFGDGIYEGIRAYDGRLFQVPRHMNRLREGLAAAGIPWDPSHLPRDTEALLHANNLADAFVYWQITRGVPAPGEPLRVRVPTPGLRPTIFGFCIPQPTIAHFAAPPTCSAAVVPDTRWTRGRLKSISLLGNVLAAIEARDAGAADAILVRDGLVGEGTHSNLILAVPTPAGIEVVTPSLDSVPILAGVTRATLLDLNPWIVERPVRVEELARATEIMLVGTTSLVTSVVTLDSRPVGEGQPGPVARRLLDSLVQCVQRELIARTTGTTTCTRSPAVA